VVAGSFLILLLCHVHLLSWCVLLRIPAGLFVAVRAQLRGFTELCRELWQALRTCVLREAVGMRREGLRHLGDAVRVIRCRGAFVPVAVFVLVATMHP